MNNTLFITLCLTFLLGACNRSSLDIVGSWSAIDVEYDFDITCDNCNEEQHELMRAQTAISIERTARSMLKASHLEFTEKKVIGKLAGDKINSTYKVLNDKINIETKNGNESFNIIEKDKLIILSIPVNENDLKKMKGSRIVPEVGKVSMNITKLETLFTKDANQ